ncbi:hypothetical protein H4R35_001918 [Dimargaris xerosporica]|nr:hypothetical protein H4R35_001918 [Dimargaris xerosporica]
MVDHREEITTIFVVGFPDDMLEREFQNMFTFCPEFEAAILKVPTSGNHSDGDDSGSVTTASTNTRKQSIGFAKFRTRAAACEARNLLTGRRVDLDKNCVLKAEMAKKNLHAKRGLGSTNNNVHAPHHPHGLGHDAASSGYLFPTVSTAHVGKRFDPFCSSAPVTPLSTGGGPPAGLGVAGSSTSVTTAADLFPPNDNGVFDFYPDSGLSSLDNPSNFLQRRNSVHHAMLRDSPMSLGTSAPAARAIGFGLTKTQSERRNTNPASLNHIDQLFGSSAGSGSLLNSTMELGSLNNRLANLPLGGSSSSITPVPGLPMSCSVPTKLSIPHTRSVNSNDQNPPCNTLYVGNLPVSTSEDELRALFSKAPGYKRLSFRPKPNAGPICFVEFEDIAHALQAMRDLDGKRVTHSNNGGIRLSFSKNPLGVRPQANPTVSSSLGYPNGLRAATHTPPPTSVNHSSLFGSSFGSRHGSVLDSSLVMEPTSAAIH